MLASLESTYLQRINDVIDERLRPLVAVGDHDGLLSSDLKHATRYLCVSDHGKRARPMLCLYFHWLFDQHFHDDFLRIGVAAEFIHAASLLHDDIVDEADHRRGKNSVNKQFGNAKAVLAGDFLLTEAFDLLRNFDRELIDTAIVVVRDMTRSAMMELNIRGRTDVTASTLRTISVGKTGALFAWCGFAAARFCKRNDDALRLWEIGERIGVIFQLADDIKDFHGDKNLKDVCRDIRNRELSLPILLACDEDEALRQDFTRAFLHDEMSLDDAMRFKDRVLATKGVARAQAKMFAELDFVITALSAFQKTPGHLLLERFIRQLCGTTTS